MTFAVNLTFFPELPVTDLTEIFVVAFSTITLTDPDEET